MPKKNFEGKGFLKEVTFLHSDAVGVAVIAIVVTE